jgi:hypothetical protein
MTEVTELQRYGLDCHGLYALAMTEVTELQHYGLDCHAALAMTEVTELQRYGLDFYLLDSWPADDTFSQ